MYLGRARVEGSCRASSGMAVKQMFCRGRDGRLGAHKNRIAVCCKSSWTLRGSTEHILEHQFNVSNLVQYSTKLNTNHRP